MYYYGSLVASYPEMVTALTEFLHLSLFGQPVPGDAAAA